MRAFVTSDGPATRRDVLLLGSTGSVGVQALEVARLDPNRFRVVGLAAGGGDPAALAAQALEFGVEAIAVARATAAEDIQLAFYAEAQRRGYSRGEFRMPRILAGPRAVVELIESTPADIVLNAIVGSRGLEPTLAALGTGATLALANKESLIAGGALVLNAAAPGQLVPVDSEHSALAQALRGGRADEVDRLVVTASGGPFRGRSRAELADVTVEQAMVHPTWSMGPVITVNSATLVNKGLEVIEAQLLFDVPYDRINVVVHPQSIVHSMVTFIDGSTLAQASPPSMRLPIAVALGWPDRIAGASTPLRFDEASAWIFEPLDDEAFPAVRLAKEAGAAGGCLPAVYNAANEEAVAAFLQGRTDFTAIVDTVSEVLGAADGWRTDPAGIDDVSAAENWARARAGELLGVAAGDAVAERE
ncbi:1-deoxy-D-xylulose-5-phosphate reductoisomerase [Actinoalloteichus hymeniacidonis]|uniref:1-deoxy-D-xylulose 5-phosphate reductoisomerase n=1 Tax=Actinoalloteichus hymeniacidonis TaxID=340345 RepID=A0AAC9HNU9_9PSEU|nr:1-deoxy-D-xylulose-5-phosphate reductoisomerase [Actinoalloteichus hymeniacidonis]AOS62603.1 1-deoxy-D-xylulose 5-phosphate reductoisomerase [Actinoalloteichus hymeniacidonis]MBB5909365.1 1-deoxy-D-xylulose-5-phosphate reductoisomerase [Actinoalloteichus hymeniacidonis]